MHVNMEGIWTLLKSANRPAPQKSQFYPELLSTITLPEGHFWPFGVGVGTTLLLRSSQQRLPDEILPTYEEFIKNDSMSANDIADTAEVPVATDLGHGFIVKGSPGIGRC